MVAERKRRTLGRSGPTAKPKPKKEGGRGGKPKQGLRHGRGGLLRRRRMWSEAEATRERKRPMTAESWLGFG